jgi:hypothetical protein
MNKQQGCQISIQSSTSNQTRAGSYIPLPEWIERKKACVNIKNTDNECIKYCLIANNHFDEVPCRKIYQTLIRNGMM